LVFFTKYYKFFKTIIKNVIIPDLDSLDVKLIEQLQTDGRISITDLTERVGSSRPTVTNRLRRLLGEEIVLVRGGLNLRKCGFKMACVGLEVKSAQKGALSRALHQ
jgi:DNA-binding Lrp family transcriptional regulator